MITPYIFPFGQSVTTVQQEDRSPKKVFVLGVYASAVHAKWVGNDGKLKINALAVASEPCIFWRGEGAEDITATIDIPPDLGQLLPAAKNLNGPSGNALDDLFLTPLGITRDDAWLCDLVPYSCCNQKQKKAIRREYVPLMKDHNLPEVTLPPVPKKLADHSRQQEILAEIEQATPETIVLLGDQPIRWFLKHHDDRWDALSNFGKTADEYGRYHAAKINGQDYQILPLVHPRQAAKLGAHSEKWSALHEEWVERQ